MNNKTKISAISALTTAVLLVGLMILTPFLFFNSVQENGFSAFFALLFSMIGDIAVYASSIAFVAVALVFSIRILKTPSSEKQRSYNKKLLTAACVLIIFLAAGLIGNIGSIYPSKLGLFPLIYIIVVVVSYVFSLIAQIVSISALKKE